jgi:hypothetical protein
VERELPSRERNSYEIMKKTIKCGDVLIAITWNSAQTNLNAARSVAPTQGN